MSTQHPQPKIQVGQAADYRESYANSVQIRVSVWDFLLTFGIVHQDSHELVNIQLNNGIYVSPQQAKALWNVLGQNLAQYEQTFGKIALEPHSPPPATGPIH